MSGTGSSRFIDSTSCGSHSGKASTSGGPHCVGPAGPCAQFPALPLSFSPDSVLDGFAFMHKERPGQQKEIAFAPVHDANSSKMQKVQLNQESYLQAHATQLSSRRSDSLHNTQLQLLLNAQHQHLPLQKRLNHQHREPQQNFEMPYPLMPQYAMQHMDDQLSKKGNCASWFMQYIADKRLQIHENSRQNWEQFVKTYYVPEAKIRWCFSSYAKVGNHALGVFPQTAGIEFPCDLCRSNSRNGFVVNSEVLPMLNQIKYNNEVIDELWSLDVLPVSQLSLGLMVLGCNKAVQTSVYEQFRVVHTGRLRIAITPEMKILNWEFCVQRHEVLVNHSQVRQFMRVAQRYQASVYESGSSGVSRQSLEASCKMFVAASRSLARSLAPLALNDWGFSERYSRCLQMSQVAVSMKDLMNFSQEHKMGPLESYKLYRQQVATKLQNRTRQMEQSMVPQGTHFLEENRCTRAVAVRPEQGNNLDNNQKGIKISEPQSNPHSLQTNPPYDYSNSNITPPLIFRNNITNQNNNKTLQQQMDTGLIRNGANADVSTDNLSDNIVGLAPITSKTIPSEADDDDFLEFCNGANFDGEINPANQR